jgi:crossover junction endodeoxyribonuclease RusA
MGLKRKGLPAHVQRAIDNATPAQLGKMLSVGRPRAAAAVPMSEKRMELEALRREWAPVFALTHNSPGAVCLTLPYPISANRYWRSRVVVPKGNPRAAFTNTYVSEEAKLYKELVEEFTSANGIKPLIGELEVSIVLHRPQRSGDLDNRIKVLLDSLREILYPDDNVIAKITAERREDKTNPRAVVMFTQRADDLFGGAAGE